MDICPRPLLKDSLYNHNYIVAEYGEEVKYVINESEIVFDAADFVRCGKDLFVTLGNVTNKAGVEWLRRHLGDEYRIHEIIRTKNQQPMHIDTTFILMGIGERAIDACINNFVSKNIEFKHMIWLHGFWGELLY